MGIHVALLAASLFVLEGRKACASGASTVSEERSPVPHPRRSSPDVLAAPSAIDPERVYFDEPGDGAIWSRTRSYKARFDARGLEFFPIFGLNATRHFGIEFGLIAARVGSTPIPVEGVVAPTRTDGRVTYDRGAIAELYELRPDGCEQLFVVEAIPAAGDLVLQVRATSELSIAEAPGAGIRFESDGLGYVGYGTAIAIDAAGARVDVLEVVEGGGIELRVPSAFLARARFPMTIDPVISTFPIDATPADTLSPDVSFDESSGRWLVVFEELVTGVDGDIFAVEVDDLGALVPGSGAYIDLTTADWGRPRVANNNWANNHLVVAEYSFSDVWGRIRSAGSTTMQAQFPIAVQNGPEVHNEPDVGGDPSPAPSSPAATTYYCVTWLHSAMGGASDVLYWLVDAAGVPVAPPGGNCVQCGGGPIPYANPSISKSNGNPPAISQHWTVAWVEIGIGLTANIHARRIGPTGNILGAVITVNATAPDDVRPVASSVTDESNGRLYMVAYQRDMIGSNDIVATVLSGASQLTGGVDLQILQGIGLAEDQVLPAIDSDGCRFVVSWAESVGGSPTNYDVKAATFHYDGNGSIAISEASQTLGSSATRQDHVQVASHRSGGGSGTRHLVVWDDLVLPANHDVGAALYDGHSAVAGTSTLPTGCGGLGAPTLAGEPALGQALTIAVPGAGGAPLMLVGAAIAPSSLCAAGCALGVDLSTAVFVASNPFTATIPCWPSLIGASVAVQGVRVLVPGGCSVPVAHVTTDTLVLTIG